MSGVYFPMMLLPDKCKNCDLVFDLRASMYCPVSGNFVGFDDTPETAKCPGIPVPDHGSLIDADAVRRIVVAHDYPLRGQFNTVGNGMFTEGIFQAIDDAPTIIPSDKEK